MLWDEARPTMSWISPAWLWDEARPTMSWISPAFLGQSSRVPSRFRDTDSAKHSLAKLTSRKQKTVCNMFRRQTPHAPHSAAAPLFVQNKKVLRSTWEDHPPVSTTGFLIVCPYIHVWFCLFVVFVSTRFFLVPLPSRQFGKVSRHDKRVQGSISPFRPYCHPCCFIPVGSCQRLDLVSGVLVAHTPAPVPARAAARAQALVLVPSPTPTPAQAMGHHILCWAECKVRCPQFGNNRKVRFPFYDDTPARLLKPVLHKIRGTNGIVFDNVTMH